MSTVFVSEGVWPQLTKAARGSRQRCAVAVAYFGAGASRLLPLPKGSRLVVDASERAVKTGQTCPTDLIKLTERGVTVYSVPNLHAKVFVLGRAAYIGSANVSSRSAEELVEAVIRTTEPNSFHAARQFVLQHCLHELTPTVLRSLEKLYHPPEFGGKKTKGAERMTSKRPSLPRLLLAQLELEDWSDRDQVLHDAGMTAAKKHREHTRGFTLDSFRQKGECPFRKNDVVIQVTDEGSGRVLVSPAGNVRYIRKRHGGNRRVSFVYLERPDRRRRQLKSLAHAIGCTQKQLQRSGLIRDALFAGKLLNTLAVTP